jgi:hypothetical protein
VSEAMISSRLQVLNQAAGVRDDSGADPHAWARWAGGQEGADLGGRGWVGWQRGLLERGGVRRRVERIRAGRGQKEG